MSKVNISHKEFCQVNHFQGRALDTFERSIDIVPCLCLYMLDILDNMLQYFFLKYSLSFGSEAGEILIWVFHCFNILYSPKFIALLATYSLNFPICPSGPIHSIHLAFCFT